MRGYQSTQNVAARSNSLTAAGGLNALLGCVAVGLVAGLFTAWVDGLHLHLQLTGHKVLLWMPPIIAARLALRHRIGASAAAGATAIACLGWGANLAGPAIYTPLIVLAGSVLDAAAAFAEKHRFRAWQLIPFFGLAGSIGAMVCSVKRVITPMPRWHEIWGIPDPAASVIFYAFFGLLAGLLGSALGAGVLRLRRKPTAEGQ